VWASQVTPPGSELRELLATVRPPPPIVVDEVGAISQSHILTMLQAAAFGRMGSAEWLVRIGDRRLLHRKLERYLYGLREDSGNHTSI
jgi:hypothetical protein